MRFPGFEGEWKRYKICDVLDFFPTNSLSWEQLEYTNGDNLFNLHYGLIHKELPIQTDLKVCNLPSIKKRFTPKSYTVCEDGDIAFADASEDTNDIGKVVEFLNCAGKKIVCGLHTIHGRDKKKMTVTGFKGYAFSSIAFRNQIKRLAQGTKIFSLSTKNFNESFISIPSKEEQAKIADLLYLIDQRITTQSKIIEKYESLIKGIVDLLLHCENYPFKRINLGSLCSIKKGEQINTSKLLDKGIYYVMNGGITPSGYHTEYNTESGTISISEGGNSCGYVQFNFSKFWSGGHCYTLNEISSQILNEYLYFYLKSQEKSIMALRVGSGLPNIQKRDLEMIEVQYPDYIRQKEVVKTLSLLSDKIKIENSLLSVLLKQKQYLLNQMFI